MSTYVMDYPRDQLQMPSEKVLSHLILVRAMLVDGYRLGLARATGLGLARAIGLGL